VIEVHLVHAGNCEAKKTSEGAFYEECIVRVLDPANAEERAAVYNAYRKGKNSKQPDFHDFGADDFADDTSVSPSYLHSESSNFTTSESLAGWKQKYRFPISAISIKGTHKASVIVEITLDRAKETRELIFDSGAEAELFEAMILREKSLENRRIEKKIAASFGDKKIDAGEMITFLIEIVSGWNLPLGDFTSSDPYIKCWYNGNQVHKTKYISNARKYLQLLNASL
jgi:C2 domain